MDPCFQQRQTAGLQDYISTILQSAWHSVSTCFNIFTTNIWSRSGFKPLRDSFYTLFRTHQLLPPPPHTPQHCGDFCPLDGAVAPSTDLSHLLAFSVLQIKVRVEVDHNPLVRLRGLNQPFTFLAWMIRIRIARRREIPRLNNSYMFTAFIWKGKQKHSSCSSS